jgi:hypothetical protein
MENSTKKEIPFKKLIKDNKVAVLYSPGYGAGWSTWLSVQDDVDYYSFRQFVVFDMHLVEAVLRKDFNEVERLIYAIAPEAYLGGIRDLTVAWLDKNCSFLIEEYDGNESIKILDNNPDIFIA